MVEQKEFALSSANHAINLDERKAGAMHKLQTDKHQFEMECRVKDEQNNEAITMMPQTVETLANMSQVFAGIDAILQRQTELQEKTLATQEQILLHQTSPKTISIGGVRKNERGEVIGATVGSTLQ